MNFFLRKDAERLLISRDTHKKGKVQLSTTTEVWDEIREEIEDSQKWTLIQVFM